jgi:hypothetical protein
LTRFVVDCETLLQIAAGEISRPEGIERVRRINSLQVRFLGDKVLQQQAWKVVEELGWETTYAAEYVGADEVAGGRVRDLRSRSRAGGLRSGGGGDARRAARSLTPTRR